MAEGASEKPQCYNCGQTGHWTVACPEPTRQTPAGLVAWRNASGASHSHGKDGNAAGKKNKGPIITRYGPPPPPQSSQPPPPPPQQQPYYPPQSGYSQPPSHYQAYPSYPQHQSYGSTPYPPHQPPAPSYQHQYPPHQSHQPPPPVRHGPSGHQQPAYGSYQSHHPSLPLPPHPPQPQNSAHNRPGHPPPPSYQPPLPSHLPPAPPYQPPSQRQGDSQRHQSQPRKHQSQSANTSNNRPKPQGPNVGASGNAGPSKRPSNPAPGQLPLPTGILSLPPKPPAPVTSSSTNPDRGSKKKQKADRNTSNREDKQKGNASSKKEANKQQGQQSPNQVKPAETQNSPPDPKKQSANSKRRDRKKKKRLAKMKQDEEEAQTQGKSEAVPEKVTQQPNPETTGSAALDAPVQVDASIKEEDAKELGEVQTADKTEDTKLQSQSPQEDAEGALAPGGDDDWKWQEKSIFREMDDLPHGPDEAGKPLPIVYDDGIVLPRKWDATCIESEFVKLDNLEQFLKPICETAHWEAMKFDPAFIMEGAFPDGTTLEAAKSITLALKKSEDEAKEQARKLAEAQEELNRKQHSPGEVNEDQNERKAETRQLNSSMIASPLREPSAHQTPNSAGKRPRDETNDRQYRPGRIDRWEPNRSQDRAQERGGSYQRRRSPSPKHDTREPSVASDQSSDLSSIEAELLGRPSKKAKKEKQKQSRPPSDNRGGRRGQRIQQRSRSRDHGHDRDRSRGTPPSSRRRW